MAPKKVTSVTGEITGDGLGITLPHEHLHMEFDVCSVKVPTHVPSWPTETGQALFQLKNLGVIRQYPYSVPYNLKLNDLESKAVMMDEIIRFKELGGKTIVENTIHGLHRNIKLLQELSMESGVNIISGTGFYIAASVGSSRQNASTEEIHALMLKELTEGENEIKCGIIGEIGCSWPLDPFEKKVIQAVAELQAQTEKPITFHPARNENSPFEIMRVFTEAGGKAEDVVMCHLDRTLFKDDQLLDFAQQKTFTQFDLFGTECSYYQLADIDFLSDAQRIRKLKMLVDHGHLRQIMMSHDIHTKHRLANFGGHGFGHILQNVVPRMKTRGFSEEDLNTILIKNPRRWLCSE